MPTSKSGIGLGAKGTVARYTQFLPPLKNHSQQQTLHRNVTFHAMPRRERTEEYMSQDSIRLLQEVFSKVTESISGHRGHEEESASTQPDPPLPPWRGRAVGNASQTS